ncbi:phosphoglycerate dehydrogenase [uncultured Desulfobacter sp.]|uniref:phosphoglycerate dehydrogenase n=1 Tax=uncultured Desulfobacter sp. TaxID=240139 RepID=UPI002AA90F9A|nr:phosphoglycerate dehydrogenase [uncultured Desulfobacter sp.]
MKKVVVTCPPMLGLFDEFINPAAKSGIELVPAKVIQTLTEKELKSLLPEFDAWIIGDDPATESVFAAASAGRLKAAVKWGIGMDNVDFDACSRLGIPITNTPDMFGAEVADVAVAYLIGLARDLFLIDRSVRRDNKWIKPAGMSLGDKTVALVGFGDIGKHLARRLDVLQMKVIAYDPGVEGNADIAAVTRADWPARLEEADFVIFTCSLNAHNHHMFNKETIKKCKQGVHVINVARGPLIDETSLFDALERQHVSAAALDVFETEPLPGDSPLRSMERCIFGTHNGSNTREAVRRTSLEAIKKVREFLNG